jgi:hypothetical protein
MEPERLASMMQQSMVTLTASPTMARVFANDASQKVRVPALLLISSLRVGPVKSLTLLPKISITLAMVR